MIESITQFALRGQRDYLHSSTIFDHILKLDPCSRQICFTFHRMTSNQCVVRAEMDSEQSRRLIASYQSEGLTCYLYETEVAIETRYPCNEQAIIEHSQVSDRAATFDMPPVEGATYIECIVASYKQLLLNMNVGLGRKFVFGKLLLDLVPDGGACEVAHRRMMGTEFFEAALLEHDKEIGRLYFGIQ